MTTTGGTGHDTEPVVLDHDAPLDGDDIVVEPDAPEHPRKHHREIVVGVIVGALLIGGAAVVLATRDSGGKTQVSTASPAATRAGHPAVDQSDLDAAATTVVKPAATSKSTTATEAPPASIGKPVAVVPAIPTAPPPDAGSSPGSAGTGDTVAPTTPTPTLPPTAPPSVLTWTTDPSAVSLKAGAHAFLTVTVANPTAATVTLPHPLSCAPALQDAHGAPVGGGVVCAEMAQLMAPHSHVVADYTIYATDTGDASGAPLAAGQYTVNVEGLHNVKVTITGSLRSAP